jgi:hypothetical protein
MDNKTSNLMRRPFKLSPLNFSAPTVPDSLHFHIIGIEFSSTVYLFVEKNRIYILMLNTLLICFFNYK